MIDRNEQQKSIEPLLTPKQVAKILGVKPKTLGYWKCVGRYDLPCIKIGRKNMYRPADVEAFIERRTVTTEV